MVIPIQISLFAFGLIIGSFLNVVIFRYKPEQSAFSLFPLRGRSHCRSCGKTLSWYELIPLLSFLIQGGRCRSCKEKLSVQYPLIEFLTGLIFLTPLYFYNPQMPDYSIAAGILWTSAFIAFLVLAAIDYYWMIIPDELNLFIAAQGILRVLLEKNYSIFGDFSGSFIGNFSGLFGLRNDIWLNHLGGGIIGLAFIGLIILLTRGRGMGMGDLKLAAALGILFGWPDIAFLLAFAFIIGSLYGAHVLWAGKKALKDSVPFGPFLILGAVTLIFFGRQILFAYFGLFS